MEGACWSSVRGAGALGKAILAVISVGNLCDTLMGHDTVIEKH